MPNVKFFVDQGLLAHSGDRLAAELPALRQMLCDALRVDAAACQLAILPVWGLPDQPLANVELQILPKPDRSPELIRTTCQNLRDRIAAVLGPSVAIRAMALDPATYLALK